MPESNRKFKTYYRLGLIQNWNWPLFWFSLPFYVALGFLFDILITGNWSPLWIAIFVAVTIFEITLVVISKKTFLPWLLSKPGSGFYGLIFAGFVNSSRNLLVAFLALEFGLEESINWGQRAVTGFIAGMVFYLIFVSVSGSRIQHDITMLRLKNLQQFLIRNRAEAAELLEAEEQKLLDQTQQALLPRINKITQMLKSNQARSESIQELRALVQDQVRPLSEQLREGSAKLSSALAPAEVANIKPQFFTDQFLLRRAIRPVALLVMTALSQYLVCQIMFSPQVAQQNLLLLAAGFVLYLAVGLLIPKHKMVSRRFGITVLALLFSLLGLPMFLFNLPRLTDLPNTLMFATVIAFPIIFGMALGNSAVLDEARQEAEKHLLRDNESLSREAALFEQKLWIAKRSWSFVVHGTVQSALTAAITRLSATEELEPYQIELVLQDIKRAQDALLKTPEVLVEMNTALNAVVSTWKGICQVSWQIGERANRVLNRDNAVRICVNEIVKEAISNAVRHGDATKASVEINRSNDEVMEILVRNNGRAPLARASKGVGSQMYDELTLNWTLTHNRALGTVDLKALLPISLVTAEKF